MVVVKPLFIIFVNTNLSIKLVNQIMNGNIHAYIYAPPNIGLKLKRIFSKKTDPKSFFKIIDYPMPFNIPVFNILFTSKSFWDNIPTNYSKVFVLYNPLSLGLTINFSNILKKNIPFGMIPMTPDFNFDEKINENPSLIDEVLVKGFLFYINSNYAKNAIKRISKKIILNIRKEFKMKNNEHIERLSITPFYLYFYYYKFSLGYIENNNQLLTISKSQS